MVRGVYCGEYTSNRELTRRLHLYNIPYRHNLIKRTRMSGSINIYLFFHSILIPNICTISSGTSVYLVVIVGPLGTPVNGREQVIVAEIVRMTVLHDRIQSESRTIIQGIARGRGNRVDTGQAAHTIRSVKDLVRSTPVQGRI